MHFLQAHCLKQVRLQKSQGYSLVDCLISQFQFPETRFQEPKRQIWERFATYFSFLLYPNCPLSPAWLCRLKKG
jgi:hypothetical protein